MTPIQKAFLKAGWIQVGGADIPVFFKYIAQNSVYPFKIIFTTDANAYYHMYNEWIKSGKITEDKIDIEKIVSSQYEHLLSTPNMFAIGIAGHISDFYHHNKNIDESIAYNYIEQYLTSKMKDELQTVRDKPVID